MINIIQNLKKLIFGATSYFMIKKGSCSLRGASFVEIYRETTNYPVKLMGISFLKEKDVPVEYRICVNGEKVFPFDDYNMIENIPRNFMIPIEIAAGSLLIIEVRGGINNKNIIVLDELDVVEMR